MSGGWWKWGAGVAVALLALGGGLYWWRGPLPSGIVRPVTASVLAEPLGELPNLPEKPEPSSYTLDGCPPRGDGGDPDLNMLKNRVDRGDYVPVSFDSLTTLTWPKNVERRPIAEWPEASRNFISQYAGTPISVEGYLVTVREGSPDPAMCNRTGSSYLDWHISFTAKPRDARAASVLVEVTPRVRLNHRWTMDVIHNLLMGEHARVRLSGWLYFDPEHPGDVGVTRSTLWEINPVMQIEVQDKSRWVPLDSLVH